MMTIQDPSGNDVQIFARQGEGFVDLCTRTGNREIWEAVAVAANLYIETDNGPAPDPDVCVVETPPIVLTPAVMDGEDVVTPEVLDQRYHLNLRLLPGMLERVNDEGYPLWQLTALAWMAGQDAEPNKCEAGKERQGITMIDPDSISSPSVVWF
jgi:hypothetical protein